MTSVENLDYYSVHSGKHWVDADPERFEYPEAIEFVNAETTPIRDMDFSDDLVLAGLRRKLGLDASLAERVAESLEDFSKA